MENIDKYASESYQEAKVHKPPPSLFKILIKTPIKFIKIFTLLFIEICELIFKKIFGEDKKNIENQVVLITGGANGLGKALACRFAQEKCKLAIADINFEEAKKTAEFISKTYKISAKEFQVDVSNYEQVRKLRKEIENKLGPVDILVNNAGIVPLISLREGKPEDIQRILNVNLASHFWVNN